MPCRCRTKDCRKRFSVRVGTVLQDSKLGYQTWALAIYLMTTELKGRASMKLHRYLGITQKSAWHLVLAKAGETAAVGSTAPAPRGRAPTDSCTSGSW